MKLKDLIPLRQVNENEGDDFTAYLRKFSESYDYNAVFDYVGTKDDTKIYTADITNFGDLGLFVSKAQLIAKCSKKDCIFGLVYILNDLDKREATCCKIKKKESDGHTTFEAIKYDKEDKKNFKGDDTKFKNVIK